jgi:hypothetical protein
MTKARVVVAAMLLVAALVATGYVAWGDWDRSRLIGVADQPGAVEVEPGDDVDAERQAFAAALERRFRGLTPDKHDETCASFRAVGLEAALAFIRERHYAQPGGPRMPFFDDLAAEILSRECALTI